MNLVLQFLSNKYIISYITILKKDKIIIKIEIYTFN